MMREVSVKLPVKLGVVQATRGVEDVAVELTEMDVEDLNKGLSITTLTPTGEQVAVFPERENLTVELLTVELNRGEICEVADRLRRTIGDTRDPSDMLAAEIEAKLRALL